MATAPPARPTGSRLRVIDPYVLAHVMDHPARQKPWSLRELSAVIGCSHATLGHLRSGERTTLTVELAHRIAEAVGVETAVLFTPQLSTKSDDMGAVA